jgi:putative ABC transport system permease protein
MMTMRESLSSAAAGQEFWMRLLGIFAALGMFLATIGVYGVISYSVEQRTHEFGIRSTLGASKLDILRLVLGEGLLLTLIGLLLGIGGSFAATRQLESQLFGVTRMDPATIAAVAVVLVGVALVACYVPGRRAAGLDPVKALRDQ